MTQKRFIKLLMSLGLQRNTANAFVRRIITENRKKPLRERKRREINPT